MLIEPLLAVFGLAKKVSLLESPNPRNCRCKQHNKIELEVRSRSVMKRFVLISTGFGLGEQTKVSKTLVRLKVIQHTAGVIWEQGG